MQKHTKAMFSMVIILWAHTLVISIRNVEAHSIIIPPNVFFHLWQPNTYINFASTTSLDNVIQTNNKLYLNQYWFSVESANLTISNFFTDNELIFTVSSSSQNTSTTEIYLDDKGEPTSVYATNGTLTWSYDTSTKTLALNVALSSSVEIEVSWRIQGDVNHDGAVNTQDLAQLSNAYGSDPSKLSWDAYCDINHDSLIDVLDLSKIATDYGKTAKSN